MSYSFQAGKDCIIIDEQGKYCPWQTREAVNFTSDNVVVAPHEAFTFHPQNDVEKAAVKLAKQYYTVFKFNGYSGKGYMIAVKVGENESEFD